MIFAKSILVLRWRIIDQWLQASGNINLFGNSAETYIFFIKQKRYNSKGMLCHGAVTGQKCKSCQKCTPGAVEHVIIHAGTLSSALYANANARAYELNLLYICTYVCSGPLEWYTEVTGTSHDAAKGFAG